MEEVFGMTKVLYIVVQHPKNSPQKWKNIWLDDDRLESITTTRTVAGQCSKEDTIYVHRCGWKSIRPTISCSVRVEKINGSPDRPIVHFREPKIVESPAKRRLYGRLNSYYDVAP